MYRVIVVSDVHANTGAVKRLANIERDLTIVAGDLSFCGSIDEARTVLELLVSQGPPVVWVPGNCDSPSIVSEELPGIMVHGRRVVVDGYTLAGVGGGLYSPFNTPFEISDEEHEAILRKALQGYTEGPLIIVSHQPPYGSGLDVVRGGLYVGAKGLRRIIAEHRPILVATGHIHESWGAASVEASLVVNPGPLKENRYARVDLDPEQGAARARLYKL